MKTLLLWSDGDASVVLGREKAGRSMQGVECEAEGEVEV